MIAIIGAMKVEVSSFISQIKNCKKEKKAGTDFYLGTLEEKEIVVVQCGIGKVNAALVTQALIDNYNPSCIIFTGLAGSGRKNILIADFVLATSVVQHDFDLTHFGREKGFVPEVGKFIVSDEALNTKIVAAFDAVSKKENIGALHRGVIASGDCFVSDSKLMSSIAEDFDALAVEMEGAAVGQVAFLNNVPFSILRLISDNADENATSDFEKILEKASTCEIKIIKELLKNE